MCQAKPGFRCSSHSKKEVLKLREKIIAMETFNPDMGFEEKPLEYIKTKAQYHQAIIEF